ncbi:MAG: hypothetical protein DWQ05_01990 [Calditrichaeota bacterium]|nr:MAG: hypothetical protein DWQ05_01990 [Calditrichota bacterium]
MKTAKRFYLQFLATLPSVIILLLFGVGFLFVLNRISDQQRDVLFAIAHSNLAVLILTGLIIIAFLIALTHSFLSNYLLPLHEIKEEMQLIASGNVKHRLHPRGSDPINDLIKVINQAATTFQQMQANISEKIEQTNQQHEKEKTILASLISQLESGVIICNLAGLILLYNKQARIFLADSQGDGLGLGRSILGILDSKIISHTLMDIKAKIYKNAKNTSSVFIYVVGDGRTVRIRTIPIFTHATDMQGYILLIRDISEQVQSHGQQLQLITHLSEGCRGITANIRSAIETIQQFPKMASQKRDELHAVILKDVHALSAQIEKNTGSELLKLKSPWPLDDILLTDVLQIVRRMAEEQSTLSIEFDAESSAVWVAADLHSLAMAILFLLDKIKNLAEVESIRIVPTRKNEFVNLQMTWTGSRLGKVQVENWNSEQLIGQSSAINRTLEDVLTDHHAVFWLQENQENGESGLHLLLPVCEEPVLPPDREPVDIFNAPPQFYDFDLFHQAGQSVETDDLPLTALTYTVFDTETTGLDPAGGDEMVSIGAVRIVNGRLLASETFDQLIDPGCELSAESIQIHGITPDLLTGKPEAKEVLPRFEKFARGTILVAHNAAFDMKFLQLKEEECGIKFENPILDTLLLSSIIHTNQKHHNLDALCKRFDVQNMARHSALGDALATAEVFLNIIPLLEKGGIKTLKQAREASAKNFYNKLKY